MPRHLFISVDGPCERQDQAASKAIRSWVTRIQLDRRRGLSDKQESRRTRGALDDLVDRSLITPTATDTAVEISSASKPVDTESGAWKFMPVNDIGQLTRDARRKVQAHVARRQHQYRRELEKSEVVENASTEESIFSATPTASTPLTAFSSPTASPCRSLDDPTNPLDSYAKQLNTSASEVWARYLWQEREHGKAFGEQYREYQGWGRKWLHPLILENSAFLATTVLFTGCHLRFTRGETVMTPVILRIKSLAHECVQAALDSREDRCSDATILAVVKLALFEAIFGFRHAFHIHMQAVAQMVRLRDGLANLGMHGYVAHLLLWFDANLSELTGSPRYLGDELAITSFRRAGSDVDTFKLGVDKSGIDEIDVDLDPACSETASGQSELKSRNHSDLRIP